MDRTGIYAAEIQVAVVRSRGIIFLVALGWLVFPFLVQFLVFPSDLLRLGAFLQGVHKPAPFTAQQLAAGFIEALFILAAFSAFQFIATLMFYRRAALYGGTIARPALWPLAAVLIGVVGNAVWFVCLGYFDFEGCVVGLLSAGFTIIIELIIESLSRDFVFGNAAGFHP